MSPINSHMNNFNDKNNNNTINITTSHPVSPNTNNERDDKECLICIQKSRVVSFVSCKTCCQEVCIGCYAKLEDVTCPFCRSYYHEHIVTNTLSDLQHDNQLPRDTNYNHHSDGVTADTDDIFVTPVSNITRQTPDAPQRHSRSRSRLQSMNLDEFISTASRVLEFDSTDVAEENYEQGRYDNMHFNINIVFEDELIQLQNLHYQQRNEEMQLFEQYHDTVPDMCDDYRIELTRLRTEYNNYLKSLAHYFLDLYLEKTITIFQYTMLIDKIQLYLT